MYRIGTSTHMSCTQLTAQLNGSTTPRCTERWGRGHCRVVVHTPHTSQRPCTGDRPLSHSDADNVLRGFLLNETLARHSLPLAEALLLPQGRGDGDVVKPVAPPAHYRGTHHSRHHSTAAYNGDWGTTRFTRLAWKKEEKAVREIVFQKKNKWNKSG